MDAHKIFIKAICELGLPKLWHYALYQLGLHSGHYRRVMPSQRDDFNGTPGLAPYAQFPQISPSQRDLVLVEADQIRKGSIHLFGGVPVPLDLEVGVSSQHWSVLEKIPPERDLKFIWEPARFGWAVTLARAYAFSGDPVYAQYFWEKTLHFLDSHPPNLGRQWQSAQEVAIRILAFLFCDRVLASAPSSTAKNRGRLWQAIAEHAARIPHTLVYARAQNNNHLLSEAAGLYAAGVYLPDHPQAQKWRKMGWRWLNWGLQHQISEFGTYNQHSVNYHRLMLQLALFADHLQRKAGNAVWPEETKARLEAATRWLWALTDPETGRGPNLGANDGAYILPLSVRPFPDLRPVVNAAARAFLRTQIYPHADLQEMGDWFDPAPSPPDMSPQPQAPDMLRVDSGRGRAFLRVAQFSDRPSHADQLHVDLWWCGVNVASDPGTYRYTASPPWDNALATSKVHNTLTLDGKEQMSRAGRFLWLDWAQAEVLAHALGEDGQLAWVTAEHDGYRKLGVCHQRRLEAIDHGWLVTDTVLPDENPDGKDHQVCISWILPDWDWAFISEDKLHLNGPDFSVELRVDGADQLYLIRAGNTIHGMIQADPTWGWRSLTYGVKEPALMLMIIKKGKFPIKLTSTWQFIQ
jgi:hypothetical protein